MKRVVTQLSAIFLVASGTYGQALHFAGTVKKGQPFRHAVGKSITFGLDPTTVKQFGCDGWHIWIGPSEQEKTFADLATGPLHGFTNLDICASDFRNSDNSGPNSAGPKNVNRPGKLREVRFVTTRAENERLYLAAMKPDMLTNGLPHLNQGTVTITLISLGHLETGSQPTIEKMDFSVVFAIRPGERHR